MTRFAENGTRYAVERAALVRWLCAEYYDCAETWDEPVECDHGLAARDAGRMLNAGAVVAAEECA